MPGAVPSESVAPRSLWAVRGTPEETAAQVAAHWERLGRPGWRWVGDDAPEGIDAIAPRGLRAELGSGAAGVVLDLHRGVDPDAIGQAHGLVRRGGALILRMPPAGERPSAYAEALVCEGHPEPGGRFWARLVASVVGWTGAPPVPPAWRGRGDLQPTPEQRAALRELDGAPHGVLLADRGRGKSVTLGLLASATEGPVWLTGPSAAACAEAARVSGLDWTPLADLLQDLPAEGTVLVDEAAQLPVPLLQRLVRDASGVRFAFATTVAGYEGSGRGFALRFVPWLEARGPVAWATLQAPIRWDPGDPLEAWLRSTLLLDAAGENRAPAEDQVTCVALDRDALAGDEALLREVFGLLVGAHYRTTPADLMRLLDGANLRVHAALTGGSVNAVTLVALEGALSDGTTRAMFTGARRVRGHALPDTLVSHLGERSAGALRFVRSVRIATRPDVRRAGVASALVRHVHAHYQEADAVGTLFGATADLLAFRRSLGYRLVRVGFSRGTRTGEPSVVMLWPRSEQARALVARLRGRLAWELPRTLRMLDAEVLLDPALRAALLGHGAAPEPPDVLADVHHYASGPRPFEAAASSLAAWLEGRELGGLDALDETERALLDAKLEAAPWAEVAARLGLPVPSAMRRLRAAVRKLLASER